MFENGVLRRVFGPERDEVTGEWKKLHNEELTGEWRKLHNEELSDRCLSLSTFRVIESRRMRCVGRVARMGDRRGAYRVLVRKPEGKGQLRRP